MQCSVCQMKALVEIVARGKVFGRDQWTYHFCQHCEFIFLQPSERLNNEEEKARYLTHNNNHNDQGFSDFLEKFVGPVQDVLKNRNPKSGLDFGSGPEPVLAKKFENLGYEMSLFDPFFATSANVLKTQYDFVICHEVIEHCYQPLNELTTMVNCLKTGGVLALRTKPHPGPGALEAWHYRRDPTHVSFFQTKTFEFIAEKLNLKILKIQNDIFIFEKI